ncbi:MAG: hypothetical protein ACYCOU_02615 [Sulfobacillus sp.]
MGDAKIDVLLQLVQDIHRQKLADKQQIETIDHRLVGVESDVSSLMDRLAAAESNVSAAMNEVSSLKDRLTAAELKAEAAMNEASAAKKIAKASRKMNGYIVVAFALGPLYNKAGSMKDDSLPLAGEQPFKRQSIVWTAWKNLGLQKSWNEIAKELPGSKSSDIPTETKNRLAALLREQILAHVEDIRHAAAQKANPTSDPRPCT